MGFKCFRLWAMGQLEFNVQSPAAPAPCMYSCMPAAHGSTSSTPPPLAAAAAAAVGAANTPAAPAAAAMTPMAIPAVMVGNSPRCSAAGCNSKGEL
jgi:hypothetical protein